jgi:YebC/PmpR family DNA-binding regulatory protein
MSGHNKWSKIKHKKEASDAKKSKVFSKLVKLIQTESKLAKGDVNSPNLKSAVEKAKKENVPKDNIERAIKKGASGDIESLERVTYEAYGPGGVAIVIEALTDNRNRTGAEVKHILTENNTNLSAQGSASWAFEKKDGIWIPQTMVSIDDDDSLKLEVLIEALEDQDDVQGVYVNKE